MTHWTFLTHTTALLCLAASHPRAAFWVLVAAVAVDLGRLQIERIVEWKERKRVVGVVE